MRVSLTTGDFFLATLCPAPLPYENVHKGVKRKQYLEIDPKFAQQLEITPDTEVSMHTSQTSHLGYLTTRFCTIYNFWLVLVCLNIKICCIF